MSALEDRLREMCIDVRERLAVESPDLMPFIVGWLAGAAAQVGADEMRKLCAERASEFVNDQDGPWLPSALRAALLAVPLVGANP